MMPRLAVKLLVVQRLAEKEKLYDAKTDQVVSGRGRSSLSPRMLYKLPITLKLERDPTITPRPLGKYLIRMELEML